MKKLYLKNWAYNCSRILSTLAAMVTSDGGKVKPQELVEICPNGSNGIGREAEPIVVTHIGYIRFVLDDVMYFYEIKENPFFQPILLKTPVVDNQYSVDACGTECAMDWEMEELHCMDCSDEIIEHCAEEIYEELLAAPLATIRREMNRTRVSNTFDDGYHYENVPVAERFELVDF